MPHWLRVALLCPGLVLASGAGAADSPAQLVRDCLARIDPDVAGINPLEERCPGIADAVASLSFDAPLHDRWESEVDGAMLGGLLQLGEHFDAPPQRNSPDPRRLAEVLQAVPQQAADEPRSLWQRFKSWVERVFTPRSSAAPPEWVTRWLRDLTVPGAVREATFLLVIVLTLGLAALIVYREIRAAQLPGSAASGSPRGQASSDPSPVRVQEITLQGIADASRSQKPRMLLNLLAHELLRLGRLRTERGLTHHEVVKFARLEGVAERDDFMKLARVAERLLYAQGGVPEADIDAALAIGFDIHGQLENRTASR